MTDQLAIRVDCTRCGTYDITRKLADDWPYERGRNAMAAPLAAHLIRKLQRTGEVPLLKFDEFMTAVRTQRLPRPAEAASRLLLLIGIKSRDNPGQPVFERYDPVAAQVGVGFEADVRWLLAELEAEGMIARGVNLESDKFSARLTFAGWRRVEELQRTDRQSKFAFLARQFKDSDLDAAIEGCIKPAVAQTGFELRTVSQKAGLIDAIIESEVRLCKFLVADLSDTNAGAYWEAGFAEGLGKHVFYICKDGTKTHFDTNHRNTVWWDLKNLEPAGEKLKALIRNTLLGEAKQQDA
jgi:hypothetical protein